MLGTIATVIVSLGTMLLAGKTGVDAINKERYDRAAKRQNDAVNKKYGTTNFVQGDKSL
jgi:hypothetical protein